MTAEAAKQEIFDKKKKIIILARQHPGETVGSFVLEGFMLHLMAEINEKTDLKQGGKS